MPSAIKAGKLNIPADTAQQWQDSLDLIVDLAGIPVGLIMRVVEEDIEVFLASHQAGNPYHPGDRERLANSGLYCEAVIKTGKPLLVADALAVPQWRDNPDVKLGMISYLGFPILLPDWTPFGTICVLDRKANEHSNKVRRLIEKFRDLIQAHLGLIYMNAVLSERNRSLSDYLDELQVLRSLVPMCSTCKRIQDSAGAWHSIEQHLTSHPRVRLARNYCPDCLEQGRDDSPGPSF